VIARLVGVIHLPPLPGSPRYDGDWDALLRRVQSEAAMLRSHGFDLAMIENFGDTPFFSTKVPPVTVAAMTACAVAAAQAAPELPLGINVLRNDAEAALSIATVIGAACIRVNVHVGARVTDQGIVEGRAADTVRLRRSLSGAGGHAQIWADVDVKHSSPLAPQTEASLEQEVKDAVTRGMADALLVTGEGTGSAAPAAKLERVRKAAGPTTPLYAASGATVETVSFLAQAVDGVIVGSALRREGRAGAPLDPQRVASFAAAFRAADAFGAHPAAGRATGRAGT
jgi:membrane complex biogenesis BtpA family protein